MGYSGSRGLLARIRISKIILVKKLRIGSLASHLGVLDDEFEEFLSSGKLRKVWSWYKKVGMRVQTNRDNSINMIILDQSFALLQWAHLQRDHIIGKNIRLTWVFRPTCCWLEISSGSKISLDMRYIAFERLAKRPIERTAAKEVFKRMADYAKISWVCLHWGKVEHNICKMSIIPPNFVSATKS